MRISSDYSCSITRLLAQEKTRTAKQGAAAPDGGVEQKEISELVSLLKGELEKLAREAADPARAALLQALREKIERGEYRVNSQELAKAMLGRPGRQTAPGR